VWSPTAFSLDHCSADVTCGALLQITIHHSRTRSIYGSLVSDWQWDRVDRGSAYNKCIAQMVDTINQDPPYWYRSLQHDL